MVKNNLKTILIVAVILALAWGVFYLLYSGLDEELAQVRLETAQAKEALDMARAYTKQVEKEAAEVMEQATIDQEEAMAKIAWLETSREEARKKLAGIQAEKETIEARLDKLLGEPSPVVIPAEDLIREAGLLYPAREFKPEITFNNEDARGMFQLMVLELSNRRELDLKNNQALAAQAAQINRLQAIAVEKDKAFTAERNIREALEKNLAALKVENRGLMNVNAGLEEQVKLLEKKNGMGWVKWPIRIGLAIGAFKVGAWYGESR